MGKLAFAIKKGLTHKAPVCRHSKSLVRELEPLTPHGCTECLASGFPWVHLRLCMTCGHVGCCDNSVHKHARHHFAETGHAVMRHFEIEETPEAKHWYWCFADEALVSLPAAVRLGG